MLIFGDGMDERHDRHDAVATEVKAKEGVSSGCEGCLDVSNVGKVMGNVVIGTENVTEEDGVIQKSRNDLIKWGCFILEEPPADTGVLHEKRPDGEPLNDWALMEVIIARGCLEGRRV